jgi:Putative addiction module component
MRQNSLCEVRPGRGLVPAAALPNSAQTAKVAGFSERCGAPWNAVGLDPMTAAVKAVLKQAMQLSPEERAEVANALDGMSADAPALSPDDLAAAWRPELDHRREELERGEVQTVDAREAIAGIRARLRSDK